MEESVLANIRRAGELHQCILDQLVGEYKGGDRIVLAACFISMAMSHHESLLLLSRNERLIGSAFALFRPLVEAVFRGLYTGFLATDAQVQEIKVGHEPYPRFNDLAESLDKVLSAGGFFTKYSGQTWRTLCSYTHTGLEQLCGRIQSDGLIGANYEVTVINEVINSSTAAVVIATTSYLELVNNKEAWKAIAEQYMTLYKTPAG